MSLNPVAGAKFYIGGALDDKAVDFVEADFAGQVWTEVDGFQAMGEFGDTYTEITTSLINRGRDIKQKGTSNAGSMDNAFAVLPTDAGQLAMVAASKTRLNYAFKVVFDDKPAVKSNAVTISIAAPGVVTWNAHGLVNGTPLTLSTTGSLPTGLTAGTTYYVVNQAANTFQLSATVGGAAITTSGSQSGTHTATTIPSGSEKKFIGLVMSAAEQGGEANTIRLFGASVSINSNIVDKNAVG